MFDGALEWECGLCGNLLFVSPYICVSEHSLSSARSFVTIYLFIVVSFSVLCCGEQLPGYSIICSVVSSTLSLTLCVCPSLPVCLSISPCVCVHLSLCVCCCLQAVCVRGEQAPAMLSEPALLWLTAGGAAEPKWCPSPSVSIHTRTHCQQNLSLTAYCLNSRKPVHIVISSLFHVNPQYDV